MIASCDDEKEAYEPDIDFSAYPQKKERERKFKELIMNEIERKDKAFYDKWCNDEN